MRLDHAIFQGPLKPELERAERPAPESYAKYDPDFPKTIDVWVVQKGELRTEIDYGLVSDPYGFEDSPDAECISAGVNSKGPLSLSLARHGNFFLWGFAGDPTQMTESGRQVFLNVLHYMKGFEGKTPIVERSCSSREWAPIMAGLLCQRADDDVRKQLFKRWFGATIRVENEEDPERVAKYVAEHLEHVFSRPDSGVQVDKNLVEAGTSSRKPEFFEVIIARLKKDPDDAVARRLLGRYASDVEAPTAAEALETWFKQHRERLFFSDVGGYRWYLRPSKP